MRQVSLDLISSETVRFDNTCRKAKAAVCAYRDHPSSPTLISGSNQPIKVDAVSDNMEKLGH